MQEIDWHRTYRVILNDRPNGYRPDKEAYFKLRKLLPQCRIHGFGLYGHNNLWYLLVEDGSLPYNVFGMTTSMSINALAGVATVPKLLPPSSA